MTLPQVNLADYLSVERIFKLRPCDKEECLEALVSVLSKASQIEDPDALLKAILEREKFLSTGIGFGIAVPHAKIPSVSGFVMALGICADGIPYDSMDEKPVHICVMIAGPDGQQEQYLRILAKVTLLLRNEEVRQKLLSAAPEAALGMFRSD